MVLVWLALKGRRGHEGEEMGQEEEEEINTQEGESLSLSLGKVMKLIFT